MHAEKIDYFVNNESRIEEVTITYVRKERHKKVASRIIFNATFLNKPYTIKRGIEMLTLTDIQKVSFTISIVDVVGNPAPVQGVPVWASSNPEFVSLTVADDGMSAVAEAVGPLGSAQISVTADADLGGGVTPLVGIVDISVIASDAVSLSLLPGIPEPK